MYYLLALVVIMVVFSKVQSNKRRKHATTLADSIQPGARVMTTAGIYGVIVEIESDTIVIEISEGVDVRFAKAAVARVVPDLVDDDALDGDDTLDHDIDDNGLDDADLDGKTLDDADLHAELDALRKNSADDPADKFTKRRPAAQANDARPNEARPNEAPPNEARPNEARPNEARPNEARDSRGRRGHEPGTGSVPTA